MIKVVIIEDNLMVASLNARFANKTPSVDVIATFHNCEDALSFLDVHSADLLLLDLYMPGMGGIELLKTLREKGNHIDAILITAANDAPMVEKAMRLGIVDYLIKPFVYERFAHAIHKYIIQKEMISNKETFSQEEIDQLVTGSACVEQKKAGKPQKGIQENTLTIIRECLKRHEKEYLTIDTIAEETSLSKVTARRYMNYLVENHEAKSRTNYSTGGRPSLEYRLI